jgi:hypothetical protein
LLLFRSGFPLDLDLVSVAPVDLCSCPAAGDVWFALGQQPLLWTSCYGALQFWVPLMERVAKATRHLVSWVGVFILGLESSFGGCLGELFGLLGLLFRLRFGRRFTVKDAQHR